MTKYHSFLIFFLIGLFWPQSPVMAQEYGLQATLKRMTELLADQQRQLDAQAKELEEQRELIRQLQAQQRGDQAAVPATPAPPPAETAAAPPEVASTATADPSTGSADDQSGQEQAKEALAKQQAEGPKSHDEILAELQKSMEDPASTVYDPDFPGAWYVPGTTAAMRIGGYVNLSFVNSLDPMLVRDRFIVGSIPPDDEFVPGAVEGTSVSADQTRVNLEFREQTTFGEVRAFVEGDFRGGSDNFRLRHAFGQYRAVLAGKTWTTLMDMNARPEEVDVEGMNGQVLLRHPQVRWMPRFGENISLKIALEDPQTDVINGTSERSFADLVASVDRIPDGFVGGWNYRVGVVLRELKATSLGVQVPDDNPLIVEDGISDDSTTGWGITTGGRYAAPWGRGQDYFLWQLTYGKGIGRYINDLSTVGGGDAVFDPGGNLKALPVFAGYVSYQHIWPMTWRFLDSWPGVMRSNVNFSWVDIDTYDFQDDKDYRRTFRASANLMYSPTPNVTVGLEFLWGQRTNKDRSKGTARQFQFSARYNF